MLKKGIHQKGKHVNWIRVVDVTHLYAYMKDLRFLVQVFQVFVFSIAHHFMSVLTIHIFVDVGRE